MEKELSFDAMLEQLAALGEEEKESIELAKDVSTFIETLVEARISMGLTQRQLAEKCGIKQSAIARIERIQVIPRLDTLLKIAKCLECTISIDNVITESRTDVAEITYLQEYRESKEDYHWKQNYCIK
ncbi:MAG: helix-turn-helix transcriptional regulator [Clostridia bacterium]|nr:helix-turn-helix transcriptional regulator [Clostridia bacterium]